MKKQLVLSIILFLVFAIGCAGTKALKRSEETILPSPAEAKEAPDNETQLLEKDEAAGDFESEVPSETKQEAVVPKEEKVADETASDIEERPVEEKISQAHDVSEEKISLNFDNADIYEVINALSDFLGINYLIDSAVKGKVNIYTAGEIEKSRLLPILETIFEMNNIALVKFGDFYKIVPIKEAKKEIIDINIGREILEIPSYDRVIIQLVPLHYVPSSDVIKVLKPFTSKGGDIVDYKKGNFIIIIDTTIIIRKLLNLINIIDVDAFEHMKIRFFKIENADVKDIAKELENIFTSFGIGKSPDKGIGLKFIPIERVSCILSISSIPEIFEKVEYWLGVLDTVDLEAEEQIFIYFVENGKADEIADVLKKVYGEGVPEKTRKKQPTRKRKTAPKKPAEGIRIVAGKIKIVTDDTTNSIIVRATPHDYSLIKETILKLDIIPKQVLIEVLIAEVTLSGDTQFGIEWALLGDTAEIGGYKGQDKGEISFGIGGLGTDLTKNLARGFTYRFDSNRLQAFLLAQASKNKLNILSSPHILAADNKEARIEVGQEVPIVTSEYVPQGVQSDISTSRSIEYRSTGVILTVTPRINEKGLVAMEISQEVSEAMPVVAGGIQSPVISNRKAETSLVVQDGQTIVIGGLIKDQTSKTISGVPILSSIPLLSYLFSDTKEKNEKIELIILITPHVISNLDEVDMVTEEFKEKLGQIKKLIGRSGEYWEGYK
jgi:general secretion pathway protein D